MFKNLLKWIQNLFGVATETRDTEVNENQNYSNEYKNVDNINFNAIFSNKLANYVVSDSTFEITGGNQRSDYLNETAKSIWKKIKKITSMSFGTGGVFLVPYVKNGKLYYNIVAQERVTIDKVEGDNILGATIISDIKKVIDAKGNATWYYRWTNYSVENDTHIITQKYSDESGSEISAPVFWQDIQEEIKISNVDRCLLGYIKSPINNRDTNDKYGVPVTYGCDATIEEIRTCIKQIIREYDLKEVFLGVDITNFSGGELPDNGLYKTFNSDDNSMFNVYDPAIRDGSYYMRLQELYQRLEKEIGTSRGILSEMVTANATATEIKKSMYDTFVLVDDMRSSIEKGLDDFFYACDILCNAFNLVASGEYEVHTDWDYGLIEDTEAEYTQMVNGLSLGVVKKVELRNWLYPNETLEESEKVIEEIQAQNPSIEDLLGTNGE